MKAYPKIFALGDRYILDILEGSVEITEKVDGSQFAFGLEKGELVCRSKGAVLNIDAPEKMFAAGVDHVKQVRDMLQEGVVFYGEYLQKPKHNVIKYNRIPQNHIALFGMYDEFGGFFRYERVVAAAALLSVDVVPVIFEGLTCGADAIQMLERESFLGGAGVEGIVVKNYAKDLMIGGQVMPIMAGKYVSEKFKEVHAHQWKKEHTGKGKWEDYMDSFRTEPRWQKAVQHLREAGALEGSPRDIGNLIREIQRDVSEEEAENIKAFLWNNFGKDLLRNCVRGMPEWYKETLAAGA